MAVSTLTMPFPGSYYADLIQSLAFGNKDAREALGRRLADAEEAMTILQYKGYDAATLADMVRKVPPATLRHS